MPWTPESDRGVRRLAWMSLLILTGLWLTRWPLFPIGVDPAYHLLIARQIIAAGGPLAYDWWQAAPLGRPHLYPPILHVLIAGLLRLGCSPMLALKVLSAALMPNLMLSLYVVMRRLAGEEIALGCVWMALVPFGWMLQVSEAMAAGLALIELLWWLAAVRERRWLAAAALLTLMLYTHSGVPWIALISLGCALALGAIRPSRQLWIAVGGALLAAAPWLWHLWQHRAWFHVAPRMENLTLEAMPALWVLAMAGAWTCWKRGGDRARAREWRLWLGLWLGSCAAAYPFTFRWLSGEGLLPVILLAGVGAAALAEALAARWNARRRRLNILAVVAAVTVLAPGLAVDGGRLRWRWPDAAVFHLLGVPGVPPHIKEVALWTTPMQRLSRTVAQASRPGEILWSNAPYAGGLVATLDSLATASFMFPDVPPAKPADPLAARWILWFKIRMPQEPDLQRLVRDGRLQVAAEDELAWLFRNPRELAPVHRPQAAIPWALAVVLSWMFLGFIVFDFSKGATWPK